MKKKKIFKGILLVLLAALIIFFAYNLLMIFRTGNQKISLTYSKTYYSDEEANMTVEVTNEKKYSLKSNIKLELYDKDDKKVKGSKYTYKKEKGEDANIAYNLPKDIETGTYTLKVTATSKFFGFWKDELEEEISIVSGNDENVTVSFDKGIYKPGDTINYRALVLKAADYTPVQSEDVKISIADGNGYTVYSEDLTTSEYGIVSGNFTLADEVNSGTYTLSVDSKSKKVSKTFTVNPYITPQYEVSVTSDKTNYSVGETANVTINAKYFFGEPVVNATVTGTFTIGDTTEDISGVTNEEGNFIYTKAIDEKGVASINVDVVDTSNYLIEASGTFSASSDPFEIKVLSEYGTIIPGVENDIYVFSSNISGEGVKTYGNIKVNSVSRQFITDEKGYAIVTLSKEDTASLTSDSDATIKLTASNYKDEKVTLNTTLEIGNKSEMVISTDSNKYEEGSDIDIELISSSMDLSDEEIYVYKGDKLLQIVDTVDGETTINLDDVYGLIDIYASNYGKNNKYYYYGGTYTSYVKKTIFIKPNEELNLNVTTDKTEYEPSEELNLSFTAKNENNENENVALLVSILDNQVLSLADNDLSIDNLKLALADIELSDGVSAADLYADVLDENNNTLDYMLANQSYTDPNLRTSDLDYTIKDNSNRMAKVFISGLILGIIALGFAAYRICKKHEVAFSKFLVAIVDGIVIFIVLNITLFEVINELLWDFDIVNSELLALFILIVLSFISYILILYKQREYIFELFTDILFFPGITMMVLSILTALTNTAITALFVGCVLILYALIHKTSKSRTLNAFESFVKNFLDRALKGIAFFIVLFLTLELADGDNYQLIFILVSAIYICIDKYVFRKTNIKLENRQINLSFNLQDSAVGIVGVFFVIVVFAIIGLFSILKNFSANVTAGDTINDSLSSMSSSSSSHSVKGASVDSSSSTSHGMTFGEVNEKTVTEYATDSTGASESVSSVASTIKSLFDNDDNVVSEDTSEEMSYSVDEEIIDDSSANTDAQVEKVRNVFLESLTFVPELIAKDGSANLKVNLSDNITTWKVQVVGNSLDGRTGYTTTEFKVFKEFFNDFTLPNNVIVNDVISIPVTVYNYTDTAKDITLNIVPDNNGYELVDMQNTINVNVPANDSSLVYVKIKAKASGDYTFRVESTSGTYKDIVEKTLSIGIEGIKEETIVSTGKISSKLSQDIMYKVNTVDNYKKLRVKLYTSAMTQTIENIDSMLQMPTGCFEQTSSSLYPDILVLEYLERNGLENEELKEKAYDYISKGYQKLLTYEVSGTKGGFSLYGYNPAETVITAFGLMEFKELSNVYTVDENLMNNMEDYIYSQQKSNGTFEYSSTYIGSTASTDKDAMNAYIIWALSEYNPDNTKLEKSVDYLLKNYEDIDDSYTLALIANVFANVNEKSDYNAVIDRLMDKVAYNDDTAYVTSKHCDYWGTRGRYQNIQATALASMALTKGSSNSKTNEQFVNYIISQKASNGTWYTTQATILALKAINNYEEDSTIKEQTISVTLNNDTKEINIAKDSLDYYEVEFDNVPEENKLTIDMKNGAIYYEIIEEYYKPYNEIENAGINVGRTFSSNNCKINDLLTDSVTVTNNSGEEISNLLVQITIPQGTSVDEDTLLKMQTDGIISKYEYNYKTINLYVRSVKNSQNITLNVVYRALYPETVVVGPVKAYDYYNPDIYGYSGTQNLNVN